MKFIIEKNALIFFHQGEMCRIEAWGKDSLRIRSTKQGKWTGNLWALTEKVEPTDAQVVIDEEDHWVGDGTIDPQNRRTGC